jgi:signal transduction histidine kinase
MRAVSLGERLSEQQRLLSAAEWPSWVRHGLPAFVAVIGAIAIWDNSRIPGIIPGPHPDSTMPAALLIALSVVPWVVFWAAYARRPTVDVANFSLVFAAAVIVPLAVVHVGGEWLGIAVHDSRAPQFSLMILMILVAQTAAHAPLRVVAVVEIAVLGVIAGRGAQTEQWTSWTIWLISAVGLLFGGLAMRSNFVSMQRLREARDELARQAVADERRRVAREVHDTVAHTLSVTMLHLTAARLAVERAPERAVAALEEAERQGRAGMGDIRRIVRLLRAADDDHDAPDPGARVLAAERAPIIERALPTVDELPDLVACYEAAGLAVTFDVDTGTAPAGDGIDAHACAVPPAVGLALYRVAQESLSNAAKHGTGPARVRLSVDDDGADLTVRNRCRASAGNDTRPGMGLVGMRERVVGLGGQFRAGPVGIDDSNGGGDGHHRGTGGLDTWEVEAHIPTGAPP